MEFNPHSYQQYCIDRMIQEKALGLFLDMGLGKTSITLSAVKELKYNRFEINKVLVIAPKKVAETTWTSESLKWEHTKILRVAKVLGPLKNRIRALNTKADIYVINRENVQWLVDYYKNKWPFDMVVIDELSSFKSHKAKRFKSLTHVRSHIKRIYGLTGTPAPNGMIDLWAQMYLLDEGQRLGKHIGQFRERYFDPDKRNQSTVFSYKIKPGGENAINEVIGDICISMNADDYLELPDIVNQDVKVQLDDKSFKAYQDFEKQLFLEIGDETLDAGSAAVLTNKLLQMSNGAVYTQDKDVVEIHDCKIEAFMEVVEALNGQSALVFYNFKHDLTRLRKALSRTNLRVRVLKTEQDTKDWNNGLIDILLAHPASAAYGLNLQDGGNHVIWFALNWSLELYQQAVKRLHRQGQKSTVFVHRLVSQGTRDEDVLEALEHKGDVQEYLLNSLKVRIESLKN